MQPRSLQISETGTGMFNLGFNKATWVSLLLHGGREERWSMEGHQEQFSPVVWEGVVDKDIRGSRTGRSVDPQDLVGGASLLRRNF